MLELSGSEKIMASLKKGLTTTADLANGLSWTAYDIEMRSAAPNELAATLGTWE